MTENNFVLGSPCIGQCCLDNADICVGCKRHINEITGWHSASDDRKQAILQKCAERETNDNKS